MPRDKNQLARLVRRYFAEVESFDTAGCNDDGEADSLAAATFEATLRRIIDVPVQSKEDAIAAMDWLIYEGKDSMIELGGDHSIYAQVSGHLVTAVRKYFLIQREGRARYAA
jgi:hypothetical protein